MDYLSLKQKIKKLFENNGIFEDSDIDWIIVYVTGKNRSMLPFLTDISNKDEQKIMEIACERAKHIPLDYILGKSEFFGYEFKVNKNCLIPRLDTEVLVQTVVDEAKKKKEPVSVLDIGTGSGAIAISVQKETGAIVTAVDISEDALTLAKQNAVLNHADVRFLHSNLFEAVKDEKFDFVVSNPPYIKTDVIDELDDEVKLNEPILALDGGDDGLKFYKKIISQAKEHLKDSGMIFFEIGFDQADDVSKLLEVDFKEICVIKDYGGNDRVVYATKKD